MLSTVTPPGVTATLLRVLQALADENRLRIVEALREGERCVCELQASLELSQSLLSHHLGVLRQAGIVRSRRAGRWVHYALVEDGAAELERYLEAMREDARRLPADAAGGTGGAAGSSWPQREDCGS